MPPFWPFKRGQRGPEQVEEEAPPTLTYKKGESVGRTTTTTIENKSAYTDALALFGDGSSTVKQAEDQSVRYEGVTNTPSDQPDAHEVDANASPLTGASAEDDLGHDDDNHSWIHHTDGYHYKKMADGSYESTPYVMLEDGTYAPFA